MSERSGLEVVRCDGDVAREGVAEVEEHHEGDRYDRCDGGRPERVKPEVWRSDEHGVADRDKGAEQDEERDVPRKPTPGGLQPIAAGGEGCVQLPHCVVVERDCLR